MKFSFFRYRRLSLNALLIFITAAACFYSIYFVPILFILTTNLFDILGYSFTLIRKSKTLPEKEIVHSYRIIQFMFDAVFTILLAVVFGWLPALCGVILKIFALQDLLYYFFLNEKLPLSWNWLGFTPLGWFKKIITLTEVLIQALVGLLIVTFLLIVFL